MTVSRQTLSARSLVMLGVASSMIFACGYDPQADLDQAALRIVIGGIDFETALLRLTAATAEERRDLAIRPNGESQLPLYVLSLSPGRFAVQIETLNGAGDILQCRRETGARGSEQTRLPLVFRQVDRHPCATVAGCLGNEALSEECNGLDDDCDGTPDDDLPDFVAGIGACQCRVSSCSGGKPEECTPGEPSTEEQCNGIDDDCDGKLPVDERDYDKDGVMTCSPCAPDAVVKCGDCDDYAAQRAPNLAEICDGIDNDCNGSIDDECS
ncbi:MAG: putative metal-binding motif-containing protein [Pseudomonadota bacterium]